MTCNASPPRPETPPADANSDHDLAGTTASHRSVPVDPPPAGPLLLETVRAWRGVELAPHRYRAVAFRWNGKELGHLHTAGLLDVPFPREVRSLLIDAGWATPHRYVPHSEWVTVRVATTDDVDAALAVLRLAYLYRRIIRANSAAERDCIRSELDALELPDRLRERFDDLLAYGSAVQPAVSDQRAKRSPESLAPPADQDAPDAPKEAGNESHR